MEYGAEITAAALCRIPRMGGRATVKLLPSICKRVLKEDIYRIYVTESLYAQGENKRLTKRYIDLISDKKPDTRTPEQIKDDIIKKAGLVLIDEPV